MYAGGFLSVTPIARGFTDMYGKDRYTPDARGADLLAAFKRHVKKCGYLAKDLDGDVPTRYADEMCQLSSYLEAELAAMRARRSGVLK